MYLSPVVLLHHKGVVEFATLDVNQHLRGIDFCIFFWGRRMMFDSEGTYFMKINWCFAFQKWWKKIMQKNQPLWAAHFGTLVCKNCASQKCFYYPKTPLDHFVFLADFPVWCDRDVEHIFVLILICVREPKHWVATPQVAPPQAYGETTSYVCHKRWFTKGRWVPLVFLNKLPQVCLKYDQVRYCICTYVICVQIISDLYLQIHITI